MTAKFLHNSLLFVNHFEYAKTALEHSIISFGDTVTMAVEYDNLCSLSLHWCKIQPCPL